MLSESSVSSRISLISVDPAVASHITGATGSTTLPTTSHYGSSLGKAARNPDTLRLRGHTRNISAPSTIGKKRSNSLKRVKNSTEVLRQRSIKSSKKTKGPETASDNRAGRNFTVGNVGTGGLLYLKCVLFVSERRSELYADMLPDLPHGMALLARLFLRCRRRRPPRHLLY